MHRSASIVLATAVILTCTAAVSPQKAQLDISKTTHDFGTVGVGTSPEVDFPIRNTGSAPLDLKITYVPTGLRLVRMDSTIAPSASGVVRLGVDTFQAGNTSEWKINVLTNDPAHGSLELTVKADVRTFLVLDPPSARFSFVQYGPEGGTSHVISALDDASLEVLGVDSPVDFIHTTFRELKGNERSADAEGRQWRIDLTISRMAAVGPISGYVIVRTNHPHQPRAFLPVSGFVRPLFAVTPPAVDLTGMAAPGPDRPILTLVVKNFGTDAIEITGTSSDVNGLEATVVTIDPGHIWRIELRLAAAMASGPFKGTLRLKTASKDVPEVAVPIQGVK